MKMKYLLSLTFMFYSFCLAEFEKNLQLKLILAEPGDTVYIEAGFFHMLGDISIKNKNNIVIQGSGSSKSILSFNEQVSGLNGFEVLNCKNITFQNFSIQGYRGSAFQCENIVGLYFNDIKIEHTKNIKYQNGLNGLNIKKCENFLIEYCFSNSAKNTGFSITESKNGIIRFIESEHNSIGIKIQNSSNIDIHSNNILKNAAGIFIINIPDLSMQGTKKIRVFDNIIKNNNSPINTSSIGLSSGTGIFLMAVEEIEIFNNTILDNNTFGTAIFSYLITELETKDSEYIPYSSSINLYDNIFRRSREIPSLHTELGRILFLKFYKDIPDIIYDGVINPKYRGKYDMVSDPRRVCIVDNFEANYLNLNIQRNFKSWYKPLIARYNTDENECNCTQKRIQEVVIRNNKQF